MGNSNLKVKLCKNFCSYYKPSKKEELGCQGFIIVERLINKGQKIPFTKSRADVGPLTEKKLIKVLCTACPFHEDGCDFAEKKKDAPPCGGFILLGHLLDGKIITIDDIVSIH